MTDVPAPTGRVLLIAEDDPDDRLLFVDAVEEAGLDLDLHFAHDGQQVLDYLAKPDLFPRPDLIVMDLNMPGLDGREAIARIKESSDWCAIPCVAMTTSHSDLDMCFVYAHGGNGYIVKPSSFEEFQGAIESVTFYWLSLMSQPSNRYPCPKLTRAQWRT